MKIVHTSDWHLGRVFHGVHLTDDQAHVLAQLARLVDDIRPDVVLVAGDIYDRAIPPAEAVALLDEVLSRIILDCGIPVIIISGNHDGPERLEFGTRLLARQGLHLIGRIHPGLAPIVIEDRYGPVFFCPIPYAEPAAVRANLASSGAACHNLAMQAMTSFLANRVPDGSRRVALAHAFVSGGEESESERPLSVGGTPGVSPTHFMQFNYTALGHLHRPQHLADGRIRYAGSLLKYSFSEASHRKTVTLVEMDRTGTVMLEELDLSPRRDVRCLTGFLHEIMTSPAAGQGQDDYLMVTLLDEGALLDAMGKLRKIYSNILHIERPRFGGNIDFCRPAGDHRGLSETILFSSFFEQTTGGKLTEAQERILSETLDKLYRRERGDPS